MCLLVPHVYSKLSFDSSARCTHNKCTDVQTNLEHDSLASLYIASVMLVIVYMILTFSLQRLRLWRNQLTENISVDTRLHLCNPERLTQTVNWHKMRLQESNQNRPNWLFGLYVRLKRSIFTISRVRLIRYSAAQNRKDMAFKFYWVSLSCLDLK